jgi:predicted regulator of Ras-like GTPase activity (Roadblock/LC7/MglB family)
MSFDVILRNIVENAGGGLAAALMGNDGIPIEHFVASTPREGLGEDDVSAAGVEFGRILDEIRKASDALSGGAVSETVVSLARFQLVLRPVDADTFLVVAIAPDGNLGKARYLIRRHLLALRDQL